LEFIFGGNEMVALANFSSSSARAGHFYVWMALACIAVAVGGFAPTYWVPLATGAFMDRGPLVNVHGVLFAAWPFFFLWQTWLAAEGRLEHHRSSGVVGVSLATAMVVIGIATSIGLTHHRVAEGDGDAARAFSIVSLTSIVLFGILVAVAVANVKRPDVHKRVMLVANISILQAAVDRIYYILVIGGKAGVPFGFTPTPPVVASVPGALITDLLIVAAMAYDWRERGRPHPAYLIAGAVLLFVQVIRVPLGYSPEWIAFTHFLDGFG
jgi:hypothetical protein